MSDLLYRAFRARYVRDNLKGFRFLFAAFLCLDRGAFRAMHLLAALLSP
jgi:hypothetical protein